MMTELAETELLAVAYQWDEAMLTNEARTIGAYMAEGWIILGTDGITTRADFLERIRSGELVHTRMDMDEAHVRLMGSSGIVIARGTSAGTWRGEPFHLYEWSTSVFIRREGTWQCIHTMVCAATAPAMAE